VVEQPKNGGLSLHVLLQSPQGVPHMRGNVSFGKPKKG
jgi:hypothetical protein